jgi:hypothetical protein
MTLVVDKAQKSLSSVSIDSYLNDPKDAVNVSVQFAPIPGGAESRSNGDDQRCEQAVNDQRAEQ